MASLRCERQFQREEARRGGNPISKHSNYPISKHSTLSLHVRYRPRASTLSDLCATSTGRRHHNRRLLPCPSPPQGQPALVVQPPPPHTATCQERGQCSAGSGQPRSGMDEEQAARGYQGVGEAEFSSSLPAQLSRNRRGAHSPEPIGVRATLDAEAPQGRQEGNGDKQHHPSPCGALHCSAEFRCRVGEWKRLGARHRRTASPHRRAQQSY
mmetsp:Transcript_52206/g.130048  ORF Transcript_52206/g.130048 Transcript_52206/m.130048 type:complete len:212 (+) Transcript_52206:3-638(+)